MSAPSQPTDSSRMNTDSTNASSPGNVLSSGLAATKPKVFDEHGAVGNTFTGTSPSSQDLDNAILTAAEEGAVGGTAQKIGGPLDKEGMIGKQFTTEGAIGGTVQSVLGGQKKA